jgi:hypothetical protein
VRTAGHQSLVAAGADAWRSFGPHRGDPRPRKGYLLVYDRNLNVLTILRNQHVPSLYAAISKDGFGAPSIAGFVRSLGADKAAPTTGPIDIPFGAADDRDQCKDRTNTIVQIGGLVLGIAGGAIGSSQLSGHDNDLGNSLGVWGLSVAIGVGSAQALAPIIATYGCKDGTKSGAANSNDNTTVASLVTLVQNGAISVDQALQIAGGAGGEPAPPSVSGDLDSLLANSPDPYAGVNPMDLLNELPAPSDQSTGDGKTSTGDGETDTGTPQWITDLVNWVTTPNGGPMPGTDTSTSGGTSGTDTSGKGGPPPSSMPNPDSDGSGGPPFPVGPLGPWVAGYDPEAGGQGASGSSPKPPGRGPLSMPNPEGGGPEGPFALPYGGVFFPAPSIFGSGGVDTGAVVRSVFIEGSDSKTASCAIVGLPRMNIDGSLASAGFMQQRGGGGI